MSIRAFVALASLVFIPACLRDSAPPESVAKDLAAWMRKVKEWEPEEKRVFRAISDVTRSQYVQDEFVARTLKDALPLVRDHIHRISEHRPETSELEPIARQYREGWQDLELSFHAIIAACEAKDYLRLAKAKAQMEYARGEVLGSYAQFDQLLEENDLQLRTMRERESVPSSGTPPARSEEPAEAPS